MKAFTLLCFSIAGLGKSVAELGFEQHGITPTAKTSFSMCVPEVVEALAKTEVRDFASQNCELSAFMLLIAPQLYF